MVHRDRGKLHQERVPGVALVRTQCGKVTHGIGDHRSKDARQRGAHKDSIANTAVADPGIVERGVAQGRFSPASFG